MKRTSTGRGRRSVLRGMVGATVGVAGLAGCLGDDGGDDENPFAGGDSTENGDGENGGTDGGSGDGSGGSDGTSGDAGATDLAVGIADEVDFGGHPATQDLAGQPYFGPHPGEAAGTVVAFEDPSCSRCAAFERGTVERIRTELAAEGDATFVFRGYPIVYPWGEPASKVLEATLDRSSRAHFAMAREYYGNQGSYSTDNVYDRSRSRLAELTDVDADAVVADAQDGAFDAAVETDLAAGEAASATTTPAVYMFRDRDFRTKASGSLGFEAVRTALGL